MTRTSRALVPATRGGRMPARLPQPPEPSLLVDILWAGGLGSFASALAAATGARARGRAAVAPLNATSHWLHGRRAGRVRRVDARHTGVGVATHVASALFWAAPFVLWLRRRHEPSAVETVGAGLATAAVAAAVDYLIMPRRLTPGWEFALDRNGVGGAFAGLALGLAGGALLARAAAGSASAEEEQGQ